MEQFVIEGGHPLHGTVTPAGNKNAALPLLAACLLTDEPVTLRNLPRIRDVDTMRELICDVGARVEELDPHAWRIHPPRLTKSSLAHELCGRIRASMLLAGPMLARHGELELPLPGGDVIGRRRLDTHLLALEALGVKILYDNAQFRMQADRLQGAHMLLDESSVTAHENAIMAAALARGTAVIPHAPPAP